MIRLRHLLLLFCALTLHHAEAQTVTYDVTAETAVGTGDFTAYQLTTNRHHVLSTRPNTAYLRGAVNVEHQLAKDWTLSGAVDVVASVHADHKFYLQQCYANLGWKSFFLEVGARELKPVLRDEVLSSGTFAKGSNAKPIPQIHIGTNDFWTIPYTKNWLQLSFDFGYGKFLDSDYREDVFVQHPGVNIKYATDILYHQKHLYFRTNPEKMFFFTGGIEHVALFGGKGYNMESGELVVKEKPSNLKAFWKAIFPVGDNKYFENESMEDWIYGNHVGSMTVQLGWNIDKEHLLQAYLENIFEDGSGIRKSNGWDGLWGLEYHNKKEGRQYVRGAVVEYFQSTNQCGPLHWDSGDYPEPIRSQITDKVVGNDEYYNHSFYDSYAHYGMALGNALIVSPIYNKDGYSAFRYNRVKAWHVGVNGEVTDRLSYLVKGSYRETLGTYNLPVYPKRHSFDAMLQGIYAVGPWNFSAAYAFDLGNIYGDISTFNFKISYHGKIL